MVSGKISCCMDWLEFNSNQGLSLFRQKQILRPNRHKKFQKQDNGDFFIQLLNVWLRFTNNNSTHTSIDEILQQPTFLKPHTILDLSSVNPYFYCIPPKNISDKFTIIRDLCRFLQPGLISSTAFDEKLGFPTAKHKWIYKLVMDLIPNDWKHLLRTETFQKSLIKTFYYNNKSTRKIKNLQKLSNKETYLTLPSNITKYSKPFKFIWWPKFLGGHHILSFEIWGNTFTDWFEKSSDGYIFTNPVIHRMGDVPVNPCLRCKEREDSHPHSIFYCKLSKTTLNFISEWFFGHWTIYVLLIIT